MKTVQRIVAVAKGGVRPLIGRAAAMAATPRARRLLASRGALSLMIAWALIALLPPRPALHQEVQTNASVLAPDYISDRDRELYQSIFALGGNADAATVETTLAQVDNKVLAGYVLAEHYLNPRTVSTKEQLTVWLAHYADHPQAARIRTLAAAKGADVSHIRVSGDSLRGDGYIDHVGKKPMPDGWYRALNLWKEEKFASAASLFTVIGENKNLSSWQRAAGYYWAARCDERLGNHRLASASLKQATGFPTTFYGLLALRARGEMVTLAAAAPYVPTAIENDPHAVRARALAAVGELAHAETELRHLIADLDKSDRPAVVTLAAELNLANLQVRLSTLKGLEDEEKIFAAYPMPHWLTAAQTAIDPALILAIARQESVFREEVNSPAGAVGMMQMLPSTARMMLSGLKDDAGMDLASVKGDTLPLAEQLTNPQLNIRLGAEYVRHLIAQPYVSTNLVKVLAAYNAGPGAVAAWQKTAAKITDPLLYIESIPYGETRHYVMQVMAHYWVYQSLMGEHPTSLVALAQGHWPTV